MADLQTLTFAVVVLSAAVVVLGVAVIFGRRRDR